MGDTAGSPTHHYLDCREILDPGHGVKKENALLIHNNYFSNWTSLTSSGDICLRETHRFEGDGGSKIYLSPSVTNSASKRNGFSC